MIRAALLTDLDALSGVETSCFEGDAWSPALVASELTSDLRKVLLASDDSSVIGYGSIQVVDDVADLQRIAILPQARRRGLGRKLLEELLAEAAGLGATRILLEVASSNDVAIGLYGSFGFSTINRRHGYYADGVDALVMERMLGAAS